MAKKKITSKSSSLYNQPLNGLSFTPSEILKVWEKNILPIKNKSKKLWGKDKYGTTLCFDEYGNMESPFGWHIDHKKPKAKEGTDHINNLQPLFWYRNILKSDTYPYTQDIADGHNELVDAAINVLKALEDFRQAKAAAKK